MYRLNEKGDYWWQLFMGQLVLEKFLKACYVRQIDENRQKC